MCITSDLPCTVLATSLSVPPLVTAAAVLLARTDAACWCCIQPCSMFNFVLQIGYKVAAGEYWRLLTAAFVHGGLLHAGVSHASSPLATWGIIIIIMLHCTLTWGTSHKS